MQKRKDVAEQRRIRIAKRQPFMANHLERLIFIDEASVKTNMAGRRAGRPAGSVAALRHDRLEAPWVIDGAMNSEMSTLYAETQLVMRPIECDTL